MTLLCHFGLHSWFPYVIEDRIKEIVGYPPILQRCKRRCGAARYRWGTILEFDVYDQRPYEFYWEWDR